MKLNVEEYLPDGINSDIAVTAGKDPATKAKMESNYFSMIDKVRWEG